MNGGNLVGQTLDGKYKIEAEIGKGGMGTVYLATHVGTERPVALKVIASEFMQRLEFVERFRREARAAGRLRHPNVVNVTDFGFTETKTGEAAYLVMEYLDGCTLGEILEEEKQLPLAWTLDILEQVCSAVQEAHEQGIIHRDLKPDNIWLEPNQRGGYTVKVLDFGIAKLEEPMTDGSGAENLDISIAPNFYARPTIADSVHTNTIADKGNSTVISEAATIAQFAKTDLEAGTLVQPNEIDLDAGTAIFSVQPIRSLAQTDKRGTKIISEQVETNESLPKTPSTAELTRVGAVLGTPLYMSPEQCRGEKLTAHSDIYSLGVIAYQMLSGKTPFSGDYLSVMQAHKETAPPPLAAKKIRKKVKRVINSALSKNVEDRPPTAQAFAAELRAQSEGIGMLLRRAFEIYSKHLPKFISLSTLIFTPLAFITLIKVLLDIFYIGEQISEMSATMLSVVLNIVSFFVALLCNYFVFGTTTWIVAQTLAVPLRPVRLRPAIAATRKKWKRLVGTGLLTTILSFIGLIPCIAPFFIMTIAWTLVAPIVMMENLRGRAAMKRSTALVKRSLRTTTAAVLIMYAVPFIVAGLTGSIVTMGVKSFSGDSARIESIKREVIKAEKENKPLVTIEDTNGEKQIVFGKVRLDANDKPKGELNVGYSFGNRMREVIRDDAASIIMLPFQILIASLWSIIAALLYLKTRQAGGESMQDLLAQFEEADQPRTNWQRRVHERLEQTSKHASKT